MAEITEEFNSWLSDKAKADWIEIKIVQRLQQLDTKKIFIAVFHDTLRKCNNIRTPLQGIDENEYYEAANHKIPSNKFKESNFFVQSGLGSVIGSNISLDLIHNLYDLNNQATSLRLIQELFVMSIEEAFQNYRTLFDLIIQNFYQSRKLLAVSMAPQIIEQYALTLGSSNPFTILSFQSVGGKKQKKELCTFILDGSEYICEFSKKLEGKFFGSVVKISAKDGSKSRTYYLKAHQGYPATNKKDSNDTYEDTLKYSSTFQSISSDEKPVAKYYSIDLREPFMYKMLDQLGYGAKTYIMVNPYILYGLFIVTEDLNSESNLFFTIDKLPSKINLSAILDDSNFDLAPSRNTIIINLMEVNMLSWIFNLCDLHLENWGFVATEEEFTQLNIGKEPSPRPRVVIIDFLLYKNMSPLEEYFLTGEILGMKGSFSKVLDTLLYLSIASKTLPEPKEKGLKEIFDTKIKQGQIARDHLLEHLTRQIFDIIERTKAKLIKQLSQYPLMNAVISQEISSLTLRGDPLEDLMEYCNVVKDNYIRWNEFLKKGYKQQFAKLLKKYNIIQNQSKKVPQGN